MVERKKFFDPKAIVEAVLQRIGEVGEMNIDYVTFVPDGEPTLDSKLGEEIRGIKRNADVKIAVLTNSSLLWRQDVRRDLMEADLVSLKIDASNPKVYRRINRPHPSLSLKTVLRGAACFSEEYSGILITETMLVSGINDVSGELRGIASIVASMNPGKAYIAVPTRPPAEEWVKPPSSDKIVEAYEVFREVLGGRVELLLGYEGSGFHASGVGEIEAIINVHPLRIDYLEQLALDKGLDPGRVLEELLGRGARIAEYRGYKFLVKRPRLNA